MCVLYEWWLLREISVHHLLCQVVWNSTGSLLVYPCHAVVVAMQANNGQQKFFVGHTDKVLPADATSLSYFVLIYFKHFGSWYLLVSVSYDAPVLVALAQLIPDWVTVYLVVFIIFSCLGKFIGLYLHILPVIFIFCQYQLNIGCGDHLWNDLN